MAESVHIAKGLGPAPKADRMQARSHGRQGGPAFAMAVFGVHAADFAAMISSALAHPLWTKMAHWDAGTLLRWSHDLTLEIGRFVACATSAWPTERMMSR